MRFFTPDLYARFNSSDDGIADAADEEWETALATAAGRRGAFVHRVLLSDGRVIVIPFASVLTQDVPLRRRA